MKMKALVFLVVTFLGCQGQKAAPQAPKSVRAQQPDAAAPATAKPQKIERCYAGISTTHMDHDGLPHRSERYAAQLTVADGKLTLDSGSPHHREVRQHVFEIDGESATLESGPKGTFKVADNARTITIATPSELDRRLLNWVHFDDDWLYVIEFIPDDGEPSSHDQYEVVVARVFEDCPSIEDALRDEEFAKPRAIEDLIKEAAANPLKSDIALRFNWSEAKAIFATERTHRMLPNTSLAFRTYQTARGDFLKIREWGAPPKDLLPENLTPKVLTSLGGLDSEARVRIDANGKPVKIINREDYVNARKTGLDLHKPGGTPSRNAVHRLDTETLLTQDTVGIWQHIVADFAGQTFSPETPRPHQELVGFDFNFQGYQMVMTSGERRVLGYVSCGEDKKPSCVLISSTLNLDLGDLQSRIKTIIDPKEYPKSLREHQRNIIPKRVKFDRQFYAVVDPQTLKPYEFVATTKIRRPRRYAMDENSTITEFGRVFWSD